MLVILPIILIVIGYLFGAIPVGYLIGRLRGVNLLESGSGRTGGTNVLRAVGLPAATVTILGDAFKGVVRRICLCHGCLLVESFELRCSVLTASFQRLHVFHDGPAFIIGEVAVLSVFALGLRVPLAFVARIGISRYRLARVIL